MLAAVPGFVHPDDLERTEAEAAKLAEAGTDTIGFQNRYRAKDGSYRWIEWTTRPVASEGLLYAAARDITEPKQAEAALQESEERHRSLVETTGEWVWRGDSEGRITYSNPTIHAILGYRPEEVVGTLFTDLLTAPTPSAGSASGPPGSPRSKVGRDWSGACARRAGATATSRAQRCRYSTTAAR